MNFSDYLYRLLQWAIYIILIILVVSYATYRIFPWGLYGPLMGVAAIVLLWIITLPGILKRFQATGLLQKTQVIMMRSRRRLGVLMYLIAFTHYSWMKVFTYLEIGLPKLQNIPQFEIFGMLTLILLTPLFITSNNRSVKFLKNNWQKVHYLIYVAIWFAAIHISLVSMIRFIKFGIPTITIACLQIASRIRERETMMKIAALGNDKSV